MIPIHLNNIEIGLVQEIQLQYNILQEFPKQFHICI